VLAILAMLALKGALRVAPGVSAPPIPSAPLHGNEFSGRDVKTALPPNRKTGLSQVVPERSAASGSTMKGA